MENNYYTTKYRVLLKIPSCWWVFITGASGSGKTAVLKTLEKEFSCDLISYNYFDTVGIPSAEEMIARCGSTEKWQEIATRVWVHKLARLKNKKLIFLEGSFYPEFALSALQKEEINNYLLICLYVEKEIRNKRLIHFRNQPELAHDDMENYNNLLKKQTLKVGGICMETNEIDVKTSAHKLLENTLERVRENLNPLK